MTQSFNCAACGAPNEPEAGASRMACSYCGANLTIPENLRTKAIPKVEKFSPKARPIPSPEIDTSDILRKAQPIAIKAWNAYAAWTWLRWLIPTCLTLVVVGIILCATLGALPLVFGLFR